MNEMRAVLIGGPEGLTLDDRVRPLTSLVESIRCEFGNGYECFRFSGERMAFDPSVAVYEWSHRDEWRYAEFDGA